MTRVSAGKVYALVLILAIGWLIWFPSVAPAYGISLGLTVLLVIVLAASWNLISGYTGYVSFGHAGFFGVGSYTGALLIVHDTLPWWTAMMVAGLVSSLIAALIGYPTLRLRGPYFAITMFALSELARIVTTNWTSLTGGGQGVYLPILQDDTPNFLAMGILAVAAVVVSYCIGTSAIGLRLLAIREDEQAASALGIRTTAYKHAAFVVSSFFPGVAGAIYARQIGYIEPSSVFATVWSIRAIAATMLGGHGTFLGPIAGAIALTLVSEAVWAENPFLYQVVFGGLIVLVLLVMPGGIMRLLEDRGWTRPSRRL